MSSIKAIETKYNGYKFRSRLEARWAVFFTRVGLRFDYEPEGFELSSGQRYLPDFWLPDLETWLEIKPTTDAAEDQRLYQFQIDLDNARQINDPFIHFYIATGEPHPEKYCLLEFARESRRSPEGDYVLYRNSEARESQQRFTHCPLCNTIDIRYWQYKYSFGGPRGVTAGLCCMYCDVVDRNWNETDTTWFHKGWVETLNQDFIIQSNRLLEGYLAARQARFDT